MPKTKISEFSATPANNTDIDSINIAEGCAPSGINDAIRELMAQLKDFQTGAVGDSFNGPIGTSTAAAGAFTTLSASSTVSGTGFSTYLASPPAIGGTAAAAGAFTTLSASGTLGVTGVATLGAGAILNTPASVTLTNATGLPIATGVSGLGTGVATFLATPSSANLRSALTDETGTGSAVFATSPTLVTPALGTPSSGVVTNLTGTASININGTVGATTATTGAFTTVTASSTGSFSGILSRIHAQGTDAYLTNTTTGKANTVVGFNDSGSTNAQGVPTGYSYYGTLQNYPIAFTSSGLLSSTISSTVHAWNISGSEGMRLTSTGLGIGTSSPAKKLDVVGTIKCTTTSLGEFTIFDAPSLGGYSLYQTAGVAMAYVGAARPVFGSGSSTDFAIVATTGNSLLLGAGNALRATLDSAGNLGLGVTPSAWSAASKALQIGTAGVIEGRVGTAVFQAGANWYINSGGSYTYTTTAEATRYATNNGTHSWYNAPSGTAGNAITFTQAMTLDASGNLGVGTTSPTRRLELSSASADYQLRIGAGITSSAFTYDIGRSTVNGLFYFYGNQTGSNGYVFTGIDGERARINSSGDVLVNTTDANLNAGVGIKLRSSATIPVVGVVGSDSTNSNSGYTLYSTGAAAYRFFVTYGGTINATSIVITAISDQRLKENVRDIDTGLNSIMALKPRRFDWKEGKGQDKKNAAGFIAQEFEDVFPESVSTSMAGEDGIEYKNINHETLIPTLVKAIQEQQAIIESLKARLDAANL